jgi:hypothetical protein
MATQVTVITGSGSTAYTVNLDRRGPQGIQGEQGEKGDQGIQGEVGPPGPTDYNLLTNVPATFPPSAHTHVVSNITPVSGTHLIGRHAGGSGDAQEVSVGNGVEFQGSGIRRSALTGDVTASAGSNATTIANDAVTNAKLANMATETIKGRTTAGTGDPEDLTPAQARTVIGVSPALVVSDTAPTTPVDGQQWLRLTTEILSIYSTSKAKWIIPYARGIDPDAEAWIDAVIAAGGTLFESETITKRKASDYFSALRTDATADLFALVGRMYFPVWDVAAANAICAKSRTSGTFNGTVTHTPGYVAGNGSTGYFDPGAGSETGALGMAVGNNMLFLALSNAQNATVALAGASDSSISASNRFQITTASSVTPAGSGEALQFASTSNAANVNLVMPDLERNGVIVGTNNGTASRHFVRRSNLSGETTVSSTASETQALVNARPFFMARNTVGTGANLFTTGRMHCYGYGQAMTLNQARQFALVTKQFYESLTAITLP